MKMLRSHHVLLRSTLLQKHVKSTIGNLKIINPVRLSSTAASTKSTDGSTGSTKINIQSAVAVACASLLTGYAVGTTFTSSSSEKFDLKHRELPNGHPRGCCSCDAPHVETVFDNLTEEQKDLPSKLAKIVGESNVISGIEEDGSNTIFLKGARMGRGKALAIITPTSLQDAVKALKLAVDAKCVVVPQGANTGLTGGSVPREGEDKQRPPVVISMRKLDIMFPIDNGNRVVCLAGSGIATLANELQIWGFPNRESHSTLGSTFLNPTTAAGEFIHLVFDVNTFVGQFFIVLLVFPNPYQRCCTWQWWYTT